MNLTCGCKHAWRNFLSDGLISTNVPDATSETVSNQSTSVNTIESTQKSKHLKDKDASGECLIEHLTSGQENLWTIKVAFDSTNFISWFLLSRNSQWNCLLLSFFSLQVSRIVLKLFTSHHNFLLQFATCPVTLMLTLAKTSTWANKWLINWWHGPRTFQPLALQTVNELSTGWPTNTPEFGLVSVPRVPLVSPTSPPTTFLDGSNLALEDGTSEFTTSNELATTHFCGESCTIKWMFENKFAFSELPRSRPTGKF